MKSPDWRQHAACAGQDTETFYPYATDDDTHTTALTTCAHCPVREACLTEALDLRDYDGIWGGTTGVQRRRLIRAEQKRRRDARKSVE